MTSATTEDPPGLDPGRRAHYGDFYGGSHPDPVAVVWGNCQAESIRVLLAGSPTFPVRTVRVPPVHELGEDDMGAVAALLPHVAILITQPVRTGYRDLPIGTDDVVPALAPGATVVRWPVFRYIGLHPFSAIVRHPADPSADPPVVPYHDLRTLALAADRGRGRPPTAEALRSVAASSIAELARREGGTDIAVSDLLLPTGPRAAHTLNHPGNEVLIGLAQRIQAALGYPEDAEEPGRALLGGIQAPLEAEVISALGLEANPREDWQVDGVAVTQEEVREAQLQWYRENPACVGEGARRHADLMALLGL